MPAPAFSIPPEKTTDRPDHLSLMGLFVFIFIAFPFLPPRRCSFFFFACSVQRFWGINFYTFSLWEAKRKKNWGRPGLDDTLIDFIWPAFSVCFSCFFVSAWTIPSIDSNPYLRACCMLLFPQDNLRDNFTFLARPQFPPSRAKLTSCPFVT